MQRTLAKALQSHLTNPFRIDTEALAQSVLVDVQLPEGVLRLTVNRKQLFSTTTLIGFGLFNAISATPALQPFPSPNAEEVGGGHVTPQ